MGDTPKPPGQGLRPYLPCVGAASLASGNALAQDDEDEGTEQEATTLDRIQVTGSRLTRADVEGGTPVIVIDRDQIDATGDVSVADVLRDSTFASFGNFRPQSGSSAQSLATIDLRGLGSGRTLVLITHRASMLSLVERLIVIDQGRIVADGPKDKVLEDLQAGAIRGNGRIGP